MPFGRFSGDHVWPVLGDHRGVRRDDGGSDRYRTPGVGRAFTIEDASRKLEYDLYYMKNMSIFLDVFLV